MIWQKNKLWLFLAFFVIIAFFLDALYQPIGQDAATYLTIGKYLQRADLPYRDFYDHKPYLIYYISYLIVGKYQQYLTAFFNLFVWLMTSLLASRIALSYRKANPYIVFVLSMLSGLLYEATTFNTEAPMVLCLVSAWLLLINNKTSSYILPTAVGGFLLIGALFFKQTALISIVVMLYLIWRLRRMVILQLALSVILSLMIFLAPLIYLGIEKEFFSAVWRDTFLYYPPINILKNISETSLNMLKGFPLFLGLVFAWNEKQLRPLYLMILPLLLTFYRYYPHYYLQSVPFLAIIAGAAYSRIQWRQRIFYFYGLIIVILTTFITVLLNRPKTLEQKLICDNLKTKQGLLIAENSANFSYYCLRPISRFLYITEITEHYNAQEQVVNLIKDYRPSQDIYALWPSEQNFTNSQSLEDFIYLQGQQIASYTINKQSLFLISKQ